METATDIRIALGGEFYSLSRGSIYAQGAAQSLGNRLRIHYQGQWYALGEGLAPGETVTVDVIGSLGVQDGCYKVNVALSPDPAGAAEIALSGTLTFADGDFEAFGGTVSGSGSLLTAIPYSADKEVESWTLAAQTATPGYAVGSVEAAEIAANLIIED